MFIVPDRDIELFAKGLIGRHGRIASRVAKARADELSAIGDDEGAHAWSRVAEAVQRLLSGPSRRIGNDAVAA